MKSELKNSVEKKYNANLMAFCFAKIVLIVDRLVDFAIIYNIIRAGVI